MSSKKISEIQKCYTRWKLDRNPFREGESPRHLWAGSTEQKDFFEFVLRDASIQPRFLNFLISGDYGSGKTYYLHALKEFVEEELGELPIYFVLPEKKTRGGFKDVLQEFVKAIGIVNLVRVGEEIIEEKKIESKTEFEDLLIPLIDQVDMRGALGNLLFDEDSVNLTWAWLSGTTAQYQARSLGFLTNPKDESTALDILIGLIRFLGQKHKLIAIFIDEMEHLVGTSSTARSTREGLRGFYDRLLREQHKPGLVLFWAATAEARYQLRETLMSALLDRIDEEVTLISLKDIEAKEFVKDLIELSRNDNSDEISPPFANEEAFDYFVTSVLDEKDPSDLREFGSKGTPRRLIKRGKILFLRCCAAGIRKIQKKHIDKYIRGGA